MALALLASCSTQKANWTNVQFHNLTCHYNVWWNGNESLKAGREKLSKNTLDDYTRFLPVEKVPTADEARGVNPEMDRAIEKGVKGIKKHSIYVGGEEHVPYIKECYLLTAYATFYKQDYVSTVNTCNILLSQFPGTRACDEGAVLLARCMSRERRFTEAEAALDQLVENYTQGNFTRSQREKLYLAMVEATVPQDKYKKAVEYIHLALDCAHSNDTKARLTFLLAQIYQKLERRPVAAKYYHQVPSFGPEYVMEFNARLGEASCADLEHSDINKLERDLDAMIRDRKNEEYRDQIYYAKGEMFLGVKDAQKACDNFRRSVAVSRNNKAQKAKSALRLGEVLYDLYEDYDQAQHYYDTAMQFLAHDYPGYASIKRRSDMLTELASYTRVYQRCDSLVAVAAMPEAERTALIQRLIDTLVAQEERAKEQALIDEMSNEAKIQRNSLIGDWYFYKVETVQKGKETFRQRWGVRALEDNWFLSSKPNFNLLTLDETSSNEQDTVSANDTLSTSNPTLSTQSAGNPSDPHSPAYYLKDLPTTPAQYDSIDSLTSLCLLNAGYILYDGIHNTPRALDCYLRLAENYTSTDGIVQAFYMLYRIYDRQGNTPQANYYRDMVLLGFPDSDFANLIRDNEYYKELLRREGRVEETYEELYTQYGKRHYDRVISLANEADELFAGHPMMPKFHYWRALATARMGDVANALSLFQTLQRSLAEADSLRPLVDAQIELLGDSAYLMAHDLAPNDKTDESNGILRPSVEKSASKTEVTQSVSDDPLPEASRIYRHREGLQHYVVVIIDDRQIKATELQYRLADFNSQFYANSGYKVNAVLFTDTTQILTVHRFKTSDEAMGYYRHLLNEESPLRQYSEQHYCLFAISTQNYSTLYSRRSPDAYLPFFERYYLTPKSN